MSELRTYVDDGDVYLHAGDVENIIRERARALTSDILGPLVAPIADMIADDIHEWADKAKAS